MPLLDGAFLPPTVFILSHVLGIAGILYWKRRTRAGTLLPPWVHASQPFCALACRRLPVSKRSRERARGDEQLARGREGARGTQMDVVTRSRGRGLDSLLPEVAVACGHVQDTGLSGASDLEARRKRLLLSGLSLHFLPCLTWLSPPFPPPLGRSHIASRHAGEAGLGPARLFPD